MEFPSLIYYQFISRISVPSFKAKRFIMKGTWFMQVGRIEAWSEALIWRFLTKASGNWWRQSEKARALSILCLMFCLPFLLLFQVIGKPEEPKLVACALSIKSLSLLFQGETWRPPRFSFWVNTSLKSLTQIQWEIKTEVKAIRLDKNSFLRSS